MFDEKEVNTLREIYETIGRFLDRTLEEWDEDYLRYLLSKLYD